MKQFGKRARHQQGLFRDSSNTVSPEARTPSDGKGRRNGHLLSVGHEEDNLFPPLRGPQGAGAFLGARCVHWWRSSRSGDETKVNGPTRNMASSQISCVNFLLPLVGAPEDDYRNAITSPALKERFPSAGSVEDVIHAAIREPASFRLMSPEKLVAAIRKSSAAEAVSQWLAYQQERYGY